MFSTPARLHDGLWRQVAATLGSGDSNGIADSALAWKQGEPAKWHSRRARAARRRGDKGLGPATADEAQNQHSVDSETPEVAGTGEGALCGRAPTTVNRSQRSSVRTRAQCSVVTRSAVQSRGDPALRHAHTKEQPFLDTTRGPPQTRPTKEQPFLDTTCGPWHTCLFLH